MMRNRSRYALAVRKRDGEIAVQVHEIHSIMDRHPWMRWPFIRGVFSFVSSLRIGMSTLMESSKYYEESSLDEEEAREREAEDDAARAKREKTENGMLIGTLILSLALAIGLFSFLPVLIASPIKNLTDSHFVLALVEGVVRVLIFVGYVWLISFMKDIRRTYMYHGAEHKCINCIETGLPLNVENVRMSSREHRRERSPAEQGTPPLRYELPADSDADQHFYLYVHPRRQYLSEAAEPPADDPRDRVGIL